jgi:hypothetical protein
VGPLAELGWGSQAGFVIAKLGLMIGLPDPKVILLGALQVGVPSAKVDEKLRIVDLRAEIYGEFTPDYVPFLIGLNNRSSRKWRSAATSAADSLPAARTSRLGRRIFPASRAARTGRMRRSKSISRPRSGLKSTSTAISR